MTDAERLEQVLEILRTALREGWTTWPNTTCGRGGVGGQMLTTTGHIDALEILLDAALRGRTLADAVESYARIYPTARRLDVPQRPGLMRAGPDGRPL